MKFNFTETKIKQKPQFVNHQFYRMHQYLQRESQKSLIKTTSVSNEEI